MIVLSATPRKDCCDMTYLEKKTEMIHYSSIYSQIGFTAQKSPTGWSPWETRHVGKP